MSRRWRAELAVHVWQCPCEECLRLYEATVWFECTRRQLLDVLLVPDNHEPCDAKLSA